MYVAGTNIDVDEAPRAEVIRRDSPTTREAVNLALPTLAEEPLSVEEARRMRGSGWDGDLDELRSRRSSWFAREATQERARVAPKSDP